MSGSGGPEEDSELGEGFGRRELRGKLGVQAPTASNLEIKYISGGMSVCVKNSAN
jgi:hypothetical protein